MHAIEETVSKRNQSNSAFAEALKPTQLKWRKTLIDVMSEDGRDGRLVWYLNDGALELYRDIEGAQAQAVEDSSPDLTGELASLLHLEIFSADAG